MLHSPFHTFHVDQGGQFVEFAGWELPIHYGSIIEEHKRVRRSGGLFDVSHMGRFAIKGRHAAKLLGRVCTRRIGNMKPGQVRYSLICNERGGVLDDVLAYCYDDDRFGLVVNAANREKIWTHVNKVKEDDGLKVTLKDETLKTAMLAVQGPKVMDLIARISSEIPTLKRYRFTEKNLIVIKLMISRTGYTGEDGVEVILPAKSAGMGMKMLLKEAEDAGDLASDFGPCGLGARDTLRLEAGMALYGHELTEDIDPLTAGLNFAIAVHKDEDEIAEPYIGMEAIQRVEREGLKKVLVGLRLDGKRTPRQDMIVRKGDAQVGIVTSGCASPTLGIPIAMAYVGVEHAEHGGTLQVDLGRTTVDAAVCSTQFYKPPKKD
ncbi:MAG: glycine cleavage system aminomethyltransferase GcvT [Phycisphaerales bacterium]|nr:glycine cleavage system aminomethyltransferase GcvT [Phycisphaerales bacterium]